MVNFEIGIRKSDWTCVSPGLDDYAITSLARPGCVLVNISFCLTAGPQQACNWPLGRSTARSFLVSSMFILQYVSGTKSGV
ncbi:hypothetical protein M378DRAFT_156441 [Amanita muscaria Koide BX008]|uniref:Uncharacterized protein n=1 Tax=Amanita muscaria (strain Koide BX008) TaxID=946122 RepID=A0A0C2X7L2_AMAMK|nr:hypothetical protein M378DRAFT_156441 [Amanita muscaria Koide BX008]